MLNTGDDYLGGDKASVGIAAADKAMFKDAEAARTGWKIIHKTPQDFTGTMDKPMQRVGLRDMNMTTYSRSWPNHGYI